MLACRLVEDHARVRGVKDTAIEAQLAEINDRLDGALQQAKLACPHPVLLLLGHQRSGSTLVYQYLAAQFALGYPSNLIARFWRAPLVGLTVQRSLARHLPAPTATSFRSELGTTEGLLEPHEFSYFWNHWFPEDDRCRDPAGFSDAIANLAAAFDAPLVFKNVFNILRVGLLAELLPTAVFIRVRRNLLDVACSTLQARRRRFGTDQAWIGPRPHEIGDTTGLGPAAQIAAQLHYGDRALSSGLAALPRSRVVDLSYERFCAGPDTETGALAVLGIAARAGVASAAPFTSSRPDCSDAERDELRAALLVHFADADIAAGGR